MQGFITDGTKAIPLSSLRPEAWSPMEEDDVGSDTGLSVRRGQTRVPVLYRAIDIRAKAVSGMPFRLERNGQDVTDDAEMQPLIKRLRKLLYLTESSLCCYNAAYWEIGTNRLGRNATPFWLATSSIRPDIDTMEANPSQAVRGYWRTGGTGVYLQPKQVCHFWGPSIAVEIGPDPAMAPVAVTLAAAGLLHYLDVFAAGFFKRGAVKVTLLTVEGDPKKGEVEKLDQWWKRVASGVKNAFGSVVIRSSVKPTVIGSNVNETSAPQLTKLAREDVAIGMGVPMSLLFSNALAGGTAVAERLNFYDFTVVPECEHVIDEPLNAQYLDRLGLRLIWTPEKLEVYQSSELSKAQGLMALVGQPLMTVDEGRERMDLPPMTQAQTASTPLLPPDATVDEGNEDAPPPPAGADAATSSAVGNGSVLLLPGTMDALGTKSVQRVIDQIVAAGGKQSDEIRVWRHMQTGKWAASVGDWASEETTAAIRKVLGPDVEIDAEWVPGDGYEAVKTAHKLWQKKAIRRFKDGRTPACDFQSAAIDRDEHAAIKHALMHADSEAAIKAAFTPGEGLSEAERALYERLKGALAQAGDAAVGAIQAGQSPDLAALSSALRAALLPALTSVVNDHLADLAATVGIHFDTAATGADIAGAYVSTWLTGMEGTTRTAVERAIMSYRATPSMRREDLLNILQGGFGPRRAELIAVTALTEASNQATNRYQELLKESGILMERVWRTAADERVCLICGPLNGKPESAWKERFPNGGPAHLKCRCGTTLRSVKE